MRVLREPEYVQYSKWSKKGPVEGGVDALLLPKVLLLTQWTPMILEDTVYSIELCDYVGGRMVPDESRTEEVRRIFYDHAPRILIMEQLFVKNPYGEPPLYEKAPNGVVQVFGPADYIHSMSALASYCAKAGIASNAEIRSAINEGRLHHFEPSEEVQVKSRGRPKREFNPLQGLRKKGPRLFLLEEVNALRC